MRPPDDKTHGDEELDGLLQNWRVEECLPPRFAEGVWRRIGSQERQGRGLRSGGIPFIQWWDHSLRRPAFAVAYLGGLLVLGLSIGFWQAENYARFTEASWRAAYVQSVTPSARVQP